MINAVICTKSPAANGWRTQWENLVLNRAESRTERKSVYLYLYISNLICMVWEKLASWIGIGSEKKIKRSRTHTYTLMIQNEKSQQIFFEFSQHKHTNGWTLYIICSAFFFLSIFIYTSAAEQKKKRRRRRKKASENKNCSFVMRVKVSIFHWSIHLIVKKAKRE